MLLSRCATILSIASVLGSADLRNTDNTSTRKVPNRTRLAHDVIRGNTTTRTTTRTTLPTKKKSRRSWYSNYCHADAIANCTDPSWGCDDCGCYSCTCNPGFTGNGLSCKDIDECATHKSSCYDIDRPFLHAPVKCVNTRGSYKCEKYVPLPELGMILLLAVIPLRFLVILPYWFYVAKHCRNYRAQLQLASRSRMDKKKNGVAVVSATIEEPPALRKGLEVEVDDEQGNILYSGGMIKPVANFTGNDFSDFTGVTFRPDCYCDKPVIREVCNRQLKIPIQFKFQGQNQRGRFCVTGTRFIGLHHWYINFIRGQHRDNMVHPYRREWCRLIWLSSFDLVDRGAMLLPHKSSRVVPVVKTPNSLGDPAVAPLSEAADSNVAALVNFFANYPGLKVTIGGAIARSYRPPLVIPVAYMKNTPSTCGLVACLDTDEQIEKRDIFFSICGQVCVFLFTTIFLGIFMVIFPYMLVFLSIIFSLQVPSHDTLHFLSMTVLPEVCLWSIWYLVWEKGRAPYCRCQRSCYSVCYSDYLPRKKWTTIEYEHAGGHSVHHFHRELEHI